MSFSKERAGKQTMNVLILGSGGREHALAWKLSQSKQLGNLFIAPGNAGTAQLGINLPVDPTHFSQIKQQVLQHRITMVVVGPEEPLVRGIHDYFLADEDLKNVVVIGPQQYAAQLEGSKEFAKEFMYRHNIPTAAYQSFTAENIPEGHAFLESLSPPYVLKADGLAAGKGVLIIEELSAAKEALTDMLANKRFGAASNKVVVEEFLDGIELSCFVLTDGQTYVSLPSAKDYKRIGAGDTGPNTGGMGAVSPVPFAEDDFMKMVEDQVVKPTIEGLQKEAIPYVGFIFFGLIKVDGLPKVIEYNCRMGDPETEVVIPRLKSDLLTLLIAAGNKTLHSQEVVFEENSACTVMLVSGGYPEAYKKGKQITGLETVTDSLVFHAGTTLKEDTVLTNGGRVIAVTSYGKDHHEALKKSYQNIEKIDFDQMNFRQDIGFDL